MQSIFVFNKKSVNKGLKFLERSRILILSKKNCISENKYGYLIYKHKKKRLFHNFTFYKII